MKIIVRIKKFNQRYPPSISNSNGSSVSLCPIRHGHWCRLPDDQTRRHCLADANFTRTQLCSGSEAFNKRHYDSNIKGDAANAADTAKSLWESCRGADGSVSSTARWQPQARLRSSVARGQWRATLGCGGLSRSSQYHWYTDFPPHYSGGCGEERSHFSPELTSERLPLWQ